MFRLVYFTSDGNYKKVLHFQGVNNTINKSIQLTPDSSQSLGNEDTKTIKNFLGDKGYLQKCLTVSLDSG